MVVTIPNMKTGSIMDEVKLTARQQREREYYEEFSRRQKITEINFDPVLGNEKRPWNPYWFVYQLAMKEFDYGRRKLLDFGCGIGIDAIRFAKIGYDVSGFDISPNNITIAKRLSERYGFSNRTSFQVQTAEHLYYPLEQFDIIVGIDILHHVEIRQAIKECHRLLKKKGVAIFKEHIEVPVFDRVRNTRIVTSLFSKDKSFDKNITEDETKLTIYDIDALREVFPHISTRRFVLFSRLNRFIRRPYDRSPSIFEKLDYFIFASLPSLRKFGGGVVIILRK